MIDLLGAEAHSYLAHHLGTSPEDLRLTELGGGVSNVVVLAEAPGLRCVVKQSLEKLRVEQDWFCSRDRIYRECEAIRRFAEILPAGSVPEIVFEDQGNYTFGMTAAPAQAEPWKDLLMRGDVDVRVAAQVGSYLASWITSTAKAEKNGWTRAFLDITVFTELRLEPYYQSSAARHPELEHWLAALIKECREERISLVHGDYSPKNLLVAGTAVTIIDFEVIHFGNPSFDAAFLTNHLLLKSYHRRSYAPAYAQAAYAFWHALRGGLPDQGFEEFERSAMRHTGGLLLARVDGKSPAEYIRSDETKQEIRKAARTLLMDPVQNVGELFGRLFPQ